MNVLAGVVPADAGRIAIDGADLTGRLFGRGPRTPPACAACSRSCRSARTSRSPRTAGSCIPRFDGLGWQRRAAALMRDMLDAIFPGHGIDPGADVGGLSIARRQMVEIARAFTVTDAPARVVILDEPTSSLDSVLAAQLLAHVRRFTAGGGSVILISHLLGEVLGTADRIAVMRDARVVALDRAAAFDRGSLVRAMGSVVARGRGEARPPARGAGIRPVVRARPRGPARGGRAASPMPARSSASAGLSGHGQTELLVQVFDRAAGAEVAGPVALVAGDRQSDGIFPLWSIAANISVALARPLPRRAADRPAPRARLRRGLAAAHRHPARRTSATRSCRSRAATSRRRCSPARSAPTPASSLMDDPMRGVDVGTKQEVYAMIRDEAAAGRTFLWYTTEMDELAQCDHVYVFREGAIVADLPRAEMTEEKVIHASFRADA